MPPLGSVMIGVAAVLRAILLSLLDFTIYAYLFN
jgi:hypothetical protein